MANLFACDSNSVADSIWDFNDIKDIEKASIVKGKDTTWVSIYDSSYIYFRQYVELKIFYLIHKNKDIIKQKKTAVINLRYYHQNGDGVNYTFNFSNYDIDSISNKFDENGNSKLLILYFLNNFTPTEVMNIIHVNKFLNSEFTKEYVSFKDLFFELRECDNKCPVHERLELIYRMLRDIGLKDYWKESKKTGSKELKHKLNYMFKISNLDTLH